MKADVCVKTKYIEREIKVTCMLFGIKDNIGKIHLVGRNQKNKRNGFVCTLIE